VVAAWIAQLARGVLALALGITITLTLDHSAVFGLLTFGAFAVLTGAVILLSTLRGAYAGRMRPAFIAQAVATLVAGVVALVVPTGGVAFLAFLAGAWAIVAGLLETASGILSRSFVPLARDWILTGALTLGLGLALVLIPRDLVQNFTGPDHVARALTASIVDVGILGAWAAIVGIQLGIATITLRSEARARQQVAA
jgi:uncharacterized membrane protein HdeD (DUF308 family)